MSPATEVEDWLSLVSAGDVSPETAGRALTAWNALLQASGGLLPIPDACTGPNGEILYAWDRGRHHLEMEIIPCRPSEFFYRDRETKRSWGEDHEDGDPIPDPVLAVLPLFDPSERDNP